MRRAGAGRPRRRYRSGAYRSGWYRAAVLAAVVALGGGGGYAVAVHRSLAGPQAAVRGYFAALVRGDAPAALAYGTLPAGPHQLLTSAVLAVQRRIAAMHDVAITDTARRAGRARVHYVYRLRFPGGDRAVRGVLTVRREADGWRLTRTAVSTTLRLTAAGDRAALAGAALPTGRTLLFPGAVPVRFDSPYLQLAPGGAAVGFGAAAVTELHPEPTPAARAALRARLAATLRRCLAGGEVGCPRPSAAYVPGSVRGRVTGGLDGLRYRVAPGPAGTITISGTLTLSARYRRLDYQNVVHDGSGRLTLPVRGTAYAVTPLVLRVDPGP